MSLVERECQLSQLAQLFSSCQHGHGAVAVVTGPVAAGNSQLLYTFAGQAVQEGAVVLCASGSLAESSLPLGMLGQLLHNAVMPADDAPPSLDEPNISSILPALEAGEQERVRAMERVRTALLGVRRRASATRSRCSARSWPPRTRRRLSRRRHRSPGTG